MEAALLEKPTEVAEPQTLFDLSATEVQIKLPEQTKILFVPLKPHHFTALKMQNLLQMMDGQATRNPAQFNSKNYFDILKAYEAACEVIREEIARELSGSSEMADAGRRAPAETVGEGNAFGVGARISADNPAAG